MAWKRALGAAGLAFIAGCSSGEGDSIAPVFTAAVTDSAGARWELSGDAEFQVFALDGEPRFLLRMLGPRALDRASVFLEIQSRPPASGRYEISRVRSDSTFTGSLQPSGPSFPESESWRYVAADGEIEIEGSTYLVHGEFEFDAVGNGGLGRTVHVAGRFVAAAWEYSIDRSGGAPLF